MSSGPAPAAAAKRPVAWAWWAGALAYYIAGCLMHLQFSLWLVRQRVTSMGRLSYSDAMPALIVTTAVVLLAWLVVRIPRSPQPRATAAFWLLWLAAVALGHRYITFSLSEYFHYPQYAILAWLIARAMDPGRAHWYVGRVLFWTTLLGMGDELLQYLWTTISYSDYLDFNDFITNLVAAAAGVLLYYGTGAARPEAAARRRPIVEAVVASAVVAGVALALFSGRIVPTPAGKIPPGGLVQHADGGPQLFLQRSPGFYGSWQPSKLRGRHFVLPPGPGLVILLGLGLAFAAFGSTATPPKRARDAVTLSMSAVPPESP